MGMLVQWVLTWLKVLCPRLVKKLHVASRNLADQVLGHLFKFWLIWQIVLVKCGLEILLFGENGKRDH